ncbi:MAG: bifunctional metallophosphatase/5'-nucleotidase [Cytophagaceae bacterium]|nr:bifunctional metallophosphatase/5'-nucleotidase [Cytophagaceae bacterium]MBK9933709.1 bifunctional metallophosphatase/5'-nucleotidase [Cytophagaceae bacterium]MBL0302577.1 bifunctional metallophosphatase/5'-nucleotidase [Cytophagaceae bacterium]MBL0325403.1 bifunctional metallophosphatase/5'-nucleotidase [Cytophagaceae bacterium]
MEKNLNPRRDFLKKSLLAGVGLASTPIIAQAESKEIQTSESSINNKVTFLITSDIHAQVNTHDEFFVENGKHVFKKRGGLAVLKTMIDSLKKSNPNQTIVYDGGDFFHGHALATFTEGEALIPIFNQLGYDLILPGNWEVVYKKKKMLYDMGHANAAKVCANMWHDTTDEFNGELVYPPFWIKNMGGTKIGVIGYTDHLVPKRQSPAFSVGLRFDHPEKNLPKYVKYLKEVENCGVIVVVTHIGLAQQVGLANNPATQGVDIIIGADTHERLRKPIKGKFTDVVECGAFGSFVGKLDLKIENGRMAGYDYKLLDVDPVKYKPDTQVQALVNKALAPFKNDFNKVIGTSTVPLMRYYVMETPMDNLITDAIKWKLKPDIALSNGFRFCQPLSSKDPKTGLINITEEFLWNMLPLDSEAKTGVITGLQVKKWLEQELQNAFAPNPAKRFGGWFVRYAGMEVNFTIANETGKRVNWVKIGGKEVLDDQEYTIVACEREGDPNDTLCRIEHVKNPVKHTLMMHDIIKEYLKVHSPISPKLEKRATATDAPDTLLTQLRGYDYEFM